MDSDTAHCPNCKCLKINFMDLDAGVYLVEALSSVIFFFPFLFFPSSFWASSFCGLGISSSLLRVLIVQWN